MARGESSYQDPETTTGAEGSIIKNAVIFANSRPGREGAKVVNTQTQSLPCLRFLLLPAIGQTQPEIGRRRNPINILHGSQLPWAQSS